MYQYKKAHLKSKIAFYNVKIPFIDKIYNSFIAFYRFYLQPRCDRISDMEKKRIYMDNAATTYPKPPQVAEAVADYIANVGMNIKRGGYEKAYAAAEGVLLLRERLCSFFNGPDPRNLIFTANITASLNYVLKGWLRPGDHILTTSLEHNATMRPLVQLLDHGVTFDCIPTREDGQPDYDAIPALIKPETKAITAIHASNVSGVVVDIETLAAIAREHGLKFILDSAQSAGILPIDMKAVGIDCLTFTGHKGLLGPQGLGGFIISDEMAEQTVPLISGGTGSFSHLETMPELLPDRFEPGTMNLPAMAGLAAAMDFLEEQGIDKLHAKEQALIRRFIDGLKGNEHVRIIGADYPQRVAVVSLDFPHHDNAEIAFQLEDRFGVMTRCGLHCAPRAHKSVGTYPQGSVRFSPGVFTSEEDIDYTVEAVLSLIK